MNLTKKGYVQSILTRIEIYDITGNNVVYNPPIRFAGVANLSPLLRGIDADRRQGIVIWTPDKSVPSGIYITSARLGATHITKRIVYLK